MTRLPYALVLHGVRYVQASTLLTVYLTTGPLRGHAVKVKPETLHAHPDKYASQPQHAPTAAAPTHLDLVARARAKGHDADAIQMYLDYATAATPEQWATTAAKFGFSPDEAAVVQHDMIKREREQHRQQLRSELHRQEHVALHGQPLADYGDELDGEPPPEIQVDPGLERHASILGGLAQKHPEIAALLKAGTVQRLVHKPPQNGKHATASYNPRTRAIEIGQPEYTNTGVLVHELGHAAEEHFDAAGVTLDGPHWRRDAPAASTYGATDNPSEKWAEAWTAHLGPQHADFQQHAPEQAATVARMRQHLTHPVAAP